MKKPTTADGYPLDLAEEARRMALYVATILGDLADEVVIVGGLVPYLNVNGNRQRFSLMQLVLGKAVLPLVLDEPNRNLVLGGEVSPA